MTKTNQLLLHARITLPNFTCGRDLKANIIQTSTRSFRVSCLNRRHCPDFLENDDKEGVPKKIEERASLDQADL